MRSAFFSLLQELMKTPTLLEPVFCFVSQTNLTIDVIVNTFLGQI